HAVASADASFPALCSSHHHAEMAAGAVFFYDIGMERPNNVDGLIEKRRELVARLKLARDDIKTLTCGIDAIDVVLKLFAPEIDGRTAKPMRLPIPHAAGKGEMQRTALELLREPGEAI